ncbi:MAG: heme-binding domain-containing protein [Bryobacterales bacterium]|nr:heme-binding domain-containing protein [Bryobacterales bacterium]
MKTLKLALLVLAVMFLAAQFVQPARTNPPSDPAHSFQAIAKPTAEAVAVLDRACQDCHSNRTAWPWYSRVAPASWLVARDVNNGRRKLNFSEWRLYGEEMTRIKKGEICEQVKTGKMPPAFYTPLHREARLSPDDIRVLCAGQ